MKQYLRGTCMRLVKATLFLGLSAGLSAGAATFSASPSVISNTYAGMVTLSIGGLTNGETVVVKKFADVNTNGVIDATDWLIQQFSLTDGYIPVIGGVTNSNVPYDSTPADGVITSQLNFLTQGIAQQVVGQCLYKLSSPVGRFTPVTNLFTVTNFPYAQSFTGSVRSSGTNVPNAGVILFTPSSDGEGLGMPVAATVANNSGGYSIKVPPGTYLLWAFQNGYVANLAMPPVLTLGVGATITTNLSLVPGTRTISGKVVDAANSSIGLPGVMAAWNSTAGMLSVQFSDANGNFTASATAGQWQFGGDDAPFTLLGYLQLDDWPGVDTTAGSVSGVTLAVPKGTALFYGSVKDDQGQPLPGVALYGINDDWNGPYTSAATTDQNGRYVMAVNAGVWSAEVDNESGKYADYIFSPPRSTNVTFVSGQAVQQKFTALLATNRISGWVRQTNGIPISGVGLWANANIAGKDYQTYGRTDGAGNYALPAANGAWMVGLNCYGGSDSLQSFGNYQCPENQAVTISNNNAVAQFTVRPPEPLQITTTTLPNGTQNTFYSQQLTASGGQQPYHWNPPSGTSFPPGLSLWDDGTLSGTPSAPGTYNFWVWVRDNTSSVQVTQQLSLTVNAALQITTTWLPDGTQNASYNQQLTASGGQQPHHWYLPGGTITLPPGTMSLSDAGVLSGTPTSAGTYSFWVGVWDNTWSVQVTRYFSLTINAASPLQVTTVGLPNATNGAFYSQQLYATGGQPPYGWRVPAYSADLPANLTLATNGVLSGTPAASGGPFYFDVEVTDAAANTDDQTLSLTIVNPPPLPLVITNVSLPSGTVGAAYNAQLGATGGSTPYSWQLALGSASLPPGLLLSSGGLIYGTPTTNKTATFRVQATDAIFATTNKVLSIVIHPKPVLSQPAKPSANEFQFVVHGVAGQYYTIQGSSNLVDWNSIRVTNAPTDSFAVLLTRATNSPGFYRVKLGP